eukprot:1177092-Prorocentrum_minimum.AAC.1
MYSKVKENPAGRRSETGQRQGMLFKAESNSNCQLGVLRPQGLAYRTSCAHPSQSKLVYMTLSLAAHSVQLPSYTLAVTPAPVGKCVPREPFQRQLVSTKEIEPMNAQSDE